MSIGRKGISILFLVALILMLLLNVNLASPKQRSDHTMSKKLTCKECKKTFPFKEKEITGFKNGKCRICYCKDGELLVDSQLDLYYIDDDGFRNPATYQRVIEFEKV